MPLYGKENKGLTPTFPFPAPHTFYRITPIRISNKNYKKHIVRQVNMGMQL